MRSMHMVLYCGTLLCGEALSADLCDIVRAPQVTPGGCLDQTIAAICEASQYPLSIIMVGVGDGPWDKYGLTLSNLDMHPVHVCCT
jgi:hypothetical protein